MRVLPVLLLLAVPALADGPSEFFHVAHSAIPTPVLLETVGVLTLFPCVESTEISRCALGDQSLILLDAPGRRSSPPVPRLLRDTVPLSSNGYDRDALTRAVLEWRFPVVAVRSSFVRIVYDVPNDRRAWVSLPRAISGGRGFFTSFDRLVESRAEERFFLVPFLLPEGVPARLYSSPSRAHPAGQISDRDEILVPVAFRNGFVLVRSAWARGSDSPAPSVLGWLPIRDEQGRLLLWLVNSVTC